MAIKRRLAPGLGRNRHRPITGPSTGPSPVRSHSPEHGRLEAGRSGAMLPHGWPEAGDPSTFYALSFTLTGLQGLHILLGVVVLVWLALPGTASANPRAWIRTRPDSP